VVNQRNIYDRLLNGVVDAAYGPFGAISDQMPRVEVTTLPFESETIASASAAAWRLYKTGLFDEDFQRVHIITTFCLPHAGLHTSKEIRRLEDLKGVKLTTASRANGEIIERLGATPVTVSNPEAYGAIQRGLAGGTVLPDAAIMTFNLQEVTKYHITLGLGCTTGGFLMNKDSYARLPSDARAAIDAASGEELAKFMAAESDRQNEIAHEKIAAMPGAVYHTLEPQELHRWYDRLRPMADAWVQKTPDGAKVLAAFRAEIARIRKGS
jgi:TRAP-type C4-dicarboxylate transport system substrate-binding protein